MNNLKRFLAVLLSVTTILSAAVSCSKKEESSTENNGHYKSEDEFSVSADSSIMDENDVDISGQTIYWLSDYDLNPTNNNDRSVALSLFEDVYGGKIEWIQTDSNSKFSTLAQRLLADQPVDMFPYEWDAVPNGVVKDQYLPLDDYYEILEMDSGLWDDMKGVIDMFEYKDAHYVIPYCLSNPLLITYSRKLMEAEGLEDPYELYQKGKWDWDAMMEMMNNFVSNAPDKSARYGISGWFGQAVIQSTGRTVVTYEDGVFKNNIDDPAIEKAELLLEEISSNKLYNPDPKWLGYFPDDQSTLFFGMTDWALGASNAKNEDADLMVVPFPKAPDSDEYYLCCSFGARMLVNGSDKGEAVATYIKCERLAATNKEYKAIAKDKALVVEKSASGVVKSFVTEEQYDAIQSYLAPENITPVFDFGYGMGERMHGPGEYTYETRGVMDNLEKALLDSTDIVDSWAALRDAWTDVVSEEVDKFNK